MNKISCDICMDLIPLVKDGIASEDSYKAVIKHVNECETCNILFEDFKEITKMKNEDIKVNDKKVISKVKSNIAISAMVMIILGCFIGVSITESEWMFYNIIIMPFVGVLGYFILKEKLYFLPLCMFVFMFIWNFIKYILGIESDGMDLIGIIISSGTWATIYTCLCIFGSLIGFLLYIAFKKENK